MRVIDTWVNLNIGGQGRPEFLQAVAKDYFKRDADEFFRTYPADEILALMDRLQVERAILTTAAHRPDAHVLQAAKDHADRFALGCQLDPTRPMKAVQALERFHREHGAVLARITPFAIDVPPNAAIYYPVYAKCSELGLPITINTGIPGPPAPGECQHPMHLDRVCLHFPDLVLVMAHGADPWWGEAIRLLLKYPNLYMMTSAYAPKYLPPELIQFMNTRGSHKILFASDHPVLSFERCLGEACELPLREGVLEKYVRDNAAGLVRWD
jgi:predicted TIM-barrel fold metal-dependent hydrolase